MTRGDGPCYTPQFGSVRRVKPRARRDSPARMPGTVRFGVFELNLESGELRKSGRKIRLAGQPIQILIRLLAHPGELVAREDLRKELWPEGTYVNFEQSLTAAVKRLRQALGDSAGNPRFIETVARRGYRFIAPANAPDAAFSHSEAPVQTIHSIAVLPFENTAGDPETEYLSDGLTESVINSLSRLHGLRVMARSAVFRYKGKPVDYRFIGRKLGVAAVLLGRMSGRGDRIVIGTELVDVRNGWLIWGAQFNLKLPEIYAVDEKISDQISEKLHLRPSGQTPAEGARRTIQNTEAYDSYLKGRYHSNRIAADSLRKSIDCYQRAVEQEPGFALAHAALADSWTLLGFFGLLPPDEAMPKAKEAALKALAIDPSLAEAHSALASVLKVYDRDCAAAEREYREALRLNPNYAQAHRGYSTFLAATGRPAEAMAEMEHAHDLDPLSLVVSMEMAWNLYMAREYDRAIEHASSIAEMEPEFPSAQYILGLACEQKSRFAEAEAAFQKSLAGSRGHVSGLASLGHLYGVCGRKEEALGMLGQLDRLAAEGFVAPFWRAILYAGLGEIDSALGELENSFTHRDVWLIWLNTEPRLDSLRPDSRFRQLLERAGLKAAASSARQ